MPRTALLDGFARFAGGFTRLFPRRGAKVLDSILYPLLGNHLTVDVMQARNRTHLQGILKFGKILVISDIHIGDAVLFLTAISALRDFFPEAEIDYLVKKSMDKLLQGNREISDLWPVFTGGQFPNEKDIFIVQEMSAEYDAVFNFCPFFPASIFPDKGKVFQFTDHAPVFVKNELNPTVPNHIAYQAHRFVYDLLGPRFPIQRARPFEGPEIFLPPEAIKEAKEFLKKQASKVNGPIVFLNPDTASPYTRVPRPFLARLLEGLTQLPCTILLGEGHTDHGIGQDLLLTLPLWKRDQVVLAPSALSLEAYTALIDWSDIFISGDTGPLHLAASWKSDRHGKHTFRNRTAILSLFGATPPRFSGYDSRPGYMESEQRAESHSYQSVSSCRNLTCMHKMAKDCDASGCFQDLDVEQIITHARNLLSKSA